MMNKPQKGFTLVEVVMVLLLVGILAAVAIPNFIDLRDSAKIAVTQDTMAAIKRAITGDSRVSAGGTYVFPGYEVDVGALPSTLSDLAVKPAAVATYDPIKRTGWRGPYVDTSATTSYTKDAWGTNLVYSTSPRQIQSCGPDMTCGTADDIIMTY